MATQDCIVTAGTGIGSPGLPFYKPEQLARSPSIQQGMDPDTERRNRLQYTLFIQNVGMDLGVPQWAIYTAVYLCHQYFAKRSFQKNDKYLVAVACLYLGCKVQESPKYLRDVIRCAETRKWAKWCDEHPTERRKWEDPDHLDRVRGEVLTAERAVLYTLCFQLRIQTPYTTVLALTRDIKDGQDTSNITQVAWCLVNDSLKTHVSLIYPPEQLGAACVFLAYTTIGIEPQWPDGKTFCEYARIPADTLGKITEMLLSVFNLALQQPNTPPPIQPGVKQEIFRLQGAPGLQTRHDRLAVVPPQQQQQQQQPPPLQAPKVEPKAEPGDQPQQQPQQQQSRAKSLTGSPVQAGQLPTVKIEGAP